jgi:hypothetical protein
MISGGCLCLCIVYVYIYVYIYVCLCIVYVYVYIYVCLCIVYVYIYVYVLSISISMSTSMSVCVLSMSISMSMYCLCLYLYLCLCIVFRQVASLLHGTCPSVQVESLRYLTWARTSSEDSVVSFLQSIPKSCDWYYCLYSIVWFLACGCHLVTWVRLVNMTFAVV